MVSCLAIAPKFQEMIAGKARLPQELIDQILSNVPNTRDLRTCRLAGRQFLNSREMKQRLAQSRGFDVTYRSPKYSKLVELLNSPSTIDELVHTISVWANPKCSKDEKADLELCFSQVLPKLSHLRKLSLHNIKWDNLQATSHRALTQLYHLRELELFNCSFPNINVLLSIISVQKPGTVFLDIDSITLDDPEVTTELGSSLKTVRELVLGRSVVDHGLIGRLVELKPSLEKLSLYYANEEVITWLQPLLHASGEHLQELMIEGFWPGALENPLVLSFNRNPNLTNLEFRFYESGPDGYIEVPQDVLATLETTNSNLEEVTLCFAVESEDGTVCQRIVPGNFDRFEHVLIRKFGRSRLPRVSVCVNYMEDHLMEGFQERLFEDASELHSQGKISVSETGWI